MPITISGSLETIRQKVSSMYAVTQYHKVEGWKLFQSDEDWIYEGRHDEKECPVCWKQEGNVNGVNIPTIFSAWGREGQNIVHPHTHDSSLKDADKMRGDCRCSLTWFDYLPVLAERLFSEMEVAAG